VSHTNNLTHSFALKQRWIKETADLARIEGALIKLKTFSKRNIIFRRKMLMFGEFSSKKLSPGLNLSLPGQKSLE